MLDSWVGEGLIWRTFGWEFFKKSSNFIERESIIEGTVTDRTQHEKRARRWKNYRFGA